MRDCNGFFSPRRQPKLLILPVERLIYPLFFRQCTFRINMKPLYTILFFIGTMLLVFLTYIFLQIIDAGAAFWALTLFIAGIMVCISLLVLILKCYIKQPPHPRRK
jgi:hypothetical protein